MKQAAIAGNDPSKRIEMTEPPLDPEQKRIWRSIARGDEPSWDEAFAGFKSAVDWPSAYFWRELSAYYPDAKVVVRQD